MMDVGAQFAAWRESPAQMVRELFGVEPDPWQVEALERFPKGQRLCMKASKGVGKTAVEAWLVWNFLLTRPHPKIAVTAITGPNLADNLWTELALWRSKSVLLQQQFEWTKTRIFARSAPETWWCSARTCPQNADKTQQANTLAGLHADYIMFVLDESGGMPRGIMASAEAALSSCKEGHLVQAGNPTHLEGPLYDACTREKSLWDVVEINGDPDNPKRASRISADWARQQIQKYGRDDPYVLVNVFGQFPPASFNALIGPDAMHEAMRRVYTEYEFGKSPKIPGVDVARGGRAKSVICPRQGLQMFEFGVYSSALDSVQGAGVVARHWNDWGADACFIDATGGFGWGWYDQLKQLGRNPIPVKFSGEPFQKQRYVNKRTEMMFDFVAWIKSGGALPRNDALVEQMTAITYTFVKDLMILEPKEDVEDRIGRSLDESDAAALTFAEPVTAESRVQGRLGNAVDPNWDSLTSAVERSYGRSAAGDYSIWSRK
jgi:phage terminase large subunit